MPSRQTTDYQPGTKVARFTILRELENGKRGRRFELRCVICRDIVVSERHRLVAGKYPRCSCNRSGGHGIEEEKDTSLLDILEREEDDGD